MIDLTETERIKNAIEKQPEKFEEIIENTTLGICITDENGIYVSMNRNYLSILGYSKGEMLGQSFLMVVPKEHKQDLKDMHDEFIEVQIEIFEKFAIVGKNGENISIDVDAGFTDKINGKPHKLTFIQKVS